MPISINDVIFSTAVFICIFLVILVFSIRRKKNETEIISISTTNELKGFAILAVVFSHIGYFLVSDHTFLFPLSIFAGVGVDLFLFLSGYGLTMGMLKVKQNPLEFYARRLSKLFIPFWVTLLFFIGLSSVVLGIFYSWTTIFSSVFGIFLTSDIYNDINSPLWYFTFILFYYLVFPLVFFRKAPWFSALIIFCLSSMVIFSNPTFLEHVIHLYMVHLAAFPLGIVFAWFFQKRSLPQFQVGFRYFSIVVLAMCVGYLGINSGVGKNYLIEELISILTMLSFLGIFIFRKIEFRLFSLFGTLSYEIYLLHWPLIYRYNIFFGVLPSWVAVILYLILFIFFGWLLQKITIQKKKSV